MKKFRLIIDVTVDGNDDITADELKDGIDFDPDVDYDGISWTVIGTEGYDTRP